MLDPSLSLSPLAPVLLALSDPARSTKEILDTLEPVTPESVSLQKKSNMFVAASDGNNALRDVEGQDDCEDRM